METKCLNCGKLLTDASGTRLHSAFFDSRLPSHLPRMSDGGVTWARCARCTIATEPKAIVASLKQWRAATASTIAEQPESLDAFGDEATLREVTSHTIGWFGSTLRRMVDSTV